MAVSDITKPTFWELLQYGKEGDEKILSWRTPSITGILCSVRENQLTENVLPGNILSLGDKCFAWRLGGGLQSLECNINKLFSPC